MDFTSIENATSALTNPKNHLLDGRKLVVEYASADAVRRGGGLPRPQKDRSHADGKVRRDSPRKRKAPDETVHDDHKSKKPHSDLKSSRVDETRGKDEPTSMIRKGPRSRPKPGAALALARRESAAIQPSQSHKITF